MSLWSSLQRLDWKSRARLCAKDLHLTIWSTCQTQVRNFYSRLEQRTCVLVLEIKMNVPIITVTTHDSTGFETPLPTIHISGPPVQSSHRASL